MDSLPLVDGLFQSSCACAVSFARIALVVGAGSFVGSTQVFRRHIDVINPGTRIKKRSSARRLT